MTLCLGNYNITATFFSDPKDEKDPKFTMPHAWANRRKYFQQTLELANCDVLGLQELSPEQALDLFELFPNHKFYIFTQAQTEEVEAGKIYSTADEIKTYLLGKFIGTALIGIMYNPKKVRHSLGIAASMEVIPTDQGMFWYNVEPFKKPTATDRSQTDKGFGNMNTPRGPAYMRFTHIETNKDFYFFTSHSPISGGAKTRMECFKLENEIIKKIVNDIPFFSIGDRNLFPDDRAEESYNALVSKDVYDWFNVENHIGFTTTWLGYLYEPKQYQNQIKQSSLTDTTRLDIGISSIKSISSAHYHCIIRDTCVELLGELKEDDNLTRNFVSDHSMVVANFNLIDYCKDDSCAEYTIEKSHYCKLHTFI